MSGGYFDYIQYRIQDIYEEIERYLDENESVISEEERYSERTLAEFRKAVEILKQAEVYAQRIDWLLSGDDGEEDFHERLKKDLEELKTIKP